MLPYAQWRPLTSATTLYKQWPSGPHPHRFMIKKLALAAALVVGASSCLGTNPTFNDLNDWNQEVTDNKWANEAIFLGLNIVPVYGFAYLADIVIFNSIEFWDGEM